MRGTFPFGRNRTALAQASGSCETAPRTSAASLDRRTPGAERSGRTRPHERCGFELAGPGRHLPLLGVGAVIVAEHVEEPVGEEHRELIEERATVGPRLTAGGLDRDDHVAR